jgi:hypothetical protein
MSSHVVLTPRLRVRQQYPEVFGTADTLSGAIIFMALSTLSAGELKA